jgi:hypothetical protein
VHQPSIDIDLVYYQSTVSRRLAAASSTSISTAQKPTHPRRTPITFAAQDHVLPLATIIPENTTLCKPGIKAPKPAKGARGDGEPYEGHVEAVGWDGKVWSVQWCTVSIAFSRVSRLFGMIAGI